MNGFVITRTNDWMDNQKKNECNNECLNGCNGRMNGEGIMNEL